MNANSNDSQKTLMADKNNKKATQSISQIVQRRFLEERKIVLWGQVEDNSCRAITEQLFYFESVDPGKDITFYINTPGGSMTAGMAVYDTIRMMKSPVTVVVTGMAASMGSILLSAAKKGRRLLYPHASVLIHQPLIMGRIIAPAIDINIHADEMERQREEINQILSMASGQPIEKIRKDTDRDFYLNAKQTIEYGLADRIVTEI